jgi:small-conductance mechanosensitive channel
MQFETVRTVGAGLLASAGVAGIVIGIAAQGALSNIIAGITISFSQPIRLNDAVIFDGEYGTVEEILLSHTVICTWDNRRIMVPNSVLSAKVIQNWTIKDPSLLGVVMLHVDFTCDVENVRGWVRDIVAASDYSTPEKMSCVQVVDVTEKSMVLRVLCRAADAPSAWNLRCEIREKLIAKFREEGTSLPKIRVTEMKGAAAV